MAPDVEWPNVAAGTVLHGHDEIRRYWQDQFAAARPNADPVAFSDSRMATSS